MATAAPTEHLPSVCPLDCPDACSLDVRVEAGQVVEVGGSRVNPLTAGYICAKVRRLPEHVHGEHRVRYPGVREGRKGEGRFRRVSWDDALSLVASRMKTLSARGEGERILPLYYGGSNGYLSQNTADARLFNRLGASRLARTLCAAPSGRATAGLYGTMPGVALQDYRHSNLVILWGVNPSVSGIHLVPYLLEGQGRGARLVVIDPRRTRRLIGRLYVAPHPGTDFHWPWRSTGGSSRTGMPMKRSPEHATARRAAPEGRALTLTPRRDHPRAAPQIETLARIRGGEPRGDPVRWGSERNRNGGSAVAAVLALPAVAGKFDARRRVHPEQLRPGTRRDGGAGQMRPPRARST
jgi:anaerobic selenocysteine-containing dehydrogenase